MIHARALTVTDVLCNYQMLVEIHDVYVLKAERRKGLVKVLLTEIMRHVRDATTDVSSCISIMRLTSEPNRVEAQRLYRSAGFSLAASATEDGTNLYQYVISP